MASGRIVFVVSVALWCLCRAGQVGAVVAAAPSEPSVGSLLNIGGAGGAGGANGGAGCDPSHASCVAPACSGLAGTCPQTQPTGGGGTAGAGTGTGTGAAPSSGAEPVASSCSPSPTGNPSCGGAGPSNAGGGTGGGVQLSGGNPINLVSGNKYQVETDLAPLPGVLGLELKRHYNSRSTHAGLLGANWRMSYEAVLYDFGGQLEILQPDGQRLVFQRVPGAHAPLCVGARLADGQVRIEQSGPGSGGTSGGDRYFWRWPDGRTLLFAGGRGGGHPLQAITAATGEVLTLAYSPDGDLAQVRDPQGRALVFLYRHNSHTPHAVLTPLGRIEYVQDSAHRLVQVERTAANGTVLYHYEDRVHLNALTGISLRTLDPVAHRTLDQRLSTYGYDRLGLAVLTTRGTPLERRDGRVVAGTGIEQVTIEYVTRPLPGIDRVDALGEVQPQHPGRAIVTNSLGQRSVVVSAIVGGQFRLIEMTGPGCSTCGPGNRRYAYNAAGQLLRVIRLDDVGHPLSADVTEYDARGRVARVGRQADAAARQPQTRWMRRYAYTDVRYADGSTAVSSLPSMVAEPSVVPGKEHVLRTSYNALGQPTRVTEEGDSPLDDDGRPVPQGTPLSRSIGYRYTVVHGRSLLTEVDGPLPNGPSNSPADSDITRFEWDSRGDAVVAVTAPMGRTTRLQWDATGRIERSVGPDGVAQASADPRSDPRSAMRQGFDIAGRLQWQIDGVGILRRAEYDTEDHLLRSSVAGAGMRQEERYRYDAMGRLEAIDDSTGAERRLLHNAAGQLVGSQDPLGRWTRYERGVDALTTVQAADSAQPLRVDRRFDAHGNMVEVVAGSAPRRVTTRRMFDDFHRAVRESSGDSGEQFTRYDVADRVVESRDASLNRTLLAYDLANHVVRRTVVAAVTTAGATPFRTSDVYRYDGSRMVAAENPDQDERLVYGPRGQLNERTVAVSLGDGTVVPTQTRYGWNDRGEIALQSLPDGSDVCVLRDARGQITALELRSTHWWPFGSRCTGRPLVSALTRDLTGLSRVDYANGVRGLWQRSAQGVLARIAYARHDGVHVGGAGRDGADVSLVQTSAVAPAGAAPPGAFGLPRESGALWDSRLLYDSAGNVRVKGDIASAQSGLDARTVVSRYAYDPLDRLTIAATASGSGSTETPLAFPDEYSRVWRYLSDALGNRLLSQQDALSSDMGHTDRLRYANLSNRSDAPMNALGQSMGTAARRFVWNARGQLEAVQQGDRTVARYRYDARGERVAKWVDGVETHYLYDLQRHRVADLDARGRITREYVWVGDQPVALIDFAQPVSPYAPPHGAWARLRQALADVLDFGGQRQGDLKFVHVDHLGAPVALTDVDGDVVWSATYTPFGQRMKPARSPFIKTGMQRPDAVEFDLRLPGQWYDRETGLHYNDQRYYDPTTGRYVSPDPLGLRGGLNSFAYVDGNPLKSIDPVGLLLFAFDGTDNTDDLDWLHQNQSSYSNVFKFDRWYGSGKDQYMSGVGTVFKDATHGDIDPPPMDDMFNLSGPKRIDRMLQYLRDDADEAKDDDAAIDIDIVGFSRGAAEARDFANRVVGQTKNGLFRYKNNAGVEECQKVDFRFMGLFDTVLSTNLTWHTYDLLIPTEFSYVAQAVALNEYREDHWHPGAGLLSSWGGFPLASIEDGAKSTDSVDPKHTRIERGFIGSHADIGGGYDEGEQDLSVVALTWMVNQASAAGVSMRMPSQTIIANPVIHDKSDNLAKASTPTREDRRVDYMDGSTTKQRSMNVAGMKWSDTEQYISYGETKSEKSRFIAGHVDMNGYLKWLNDNNYGLADNLSVE